MPLRLGKRKEKEKMISLWGGMRRGEGRAGGLFLSSPFPVPSVSGWPFPFHAFSAEEKNEDLGKERKSV